MPLFSKLCTNIPDSPQYQGEARPQMKEHYNQRMMETSFKKGAPQNLALYLAAINSVAGAAGYPPWAPGSSQTAVPPRPQAWSMPPGVNHYDYNPMAFNSASAAPANNTGHDIRFESKDGDTRGTAMVYHGQ